MKKLMLLVAAIVISWVAFLEYSVQREPSEGGDGHIVNWWDVSSPDEMIGIHLRGKPEDFKEWIGDLQYPYVIVLEVAGAESSVSYTIPSVEEFPRQDFPVACPAGDYTPEKCWFVKYERDK